MQTSELEKNKNNLLGDEECIQFRPSPNFKHMKKYLKSKFEEANYSPNQSSDRSSTPTSEEQEIVTSQEIVNSQDIEKEQEIVKSQEIVEAPPSSMAQLAQPPLPPNTPPSEFLVVPKKEVEDKEYDKSNAQHLVKTAEVLKKTPAQTMCRQFARGSCSRGPNCIYAHKIILDQLPAVYTFCKNFQNTSCSLPKCKFVHATVFEKEHYYRTGFLPPHTLAHLKDSNSPLGPPKPLEGNPNEAPKGFANQPPSVHPGMPGNKPPNGGPSPDGRPNSEPLGPSHLAAQRLSSIVKREWNETDSLLAVHDGDSDGILPRKCKMCDIHELRLQCALMKRKEVREEAEMLEKQSKQLKKKEARLNNILDIVLQLNTPHSFIHNKLGLTKNIESLKIRMPLMRNPSDGNGLGQRLSHELSNRLRSMSRTQRRMLSRMLQVNDVMEDSSNSPPIARTD